jgi:hypothetical protein
VALLFTLKLPLIAAPVRLFQLQLTQTPEVLV